MLKLDRETDGISCGIDEVGRAPLAGPVVAACVIIRQENANDRFWHKVQDSKKIARQRRESLTIKIKEHSYYGIGMASEREIEKLNIHHASLLAMKRAYEKMVEDFSVEPDIALVDGRFVPKISCKGQAIIKGDSKSRAIAAASIIAKVYRDDLMLDLHDKFPFYGWDTNAGYPTPQHLKAIEEHGITDYHRRTFGNIDKHPLI